MKYKIHKKLEEHLEKHIDLLDACKNGYGTPENVEKFADSLLHLYDLVTVYVHSLQRKGKTSNKLNRAILHENILRIIEKEPITGVFINDKQLAFRLNVDYPSIRDIRIQYGIPNAAQRREIAEKELL